MYQITPDVSVYAKVARGFRGPTIQGRSAVFNADFTTADSETILSWEAGVKSSLWDNRLRLNATAFTYTVNDIQLNGNDSTATACCSTPTRPRPMVSKRTWSCARSRT